ncbi:flagellin [Pseudomonadales bacterium]|nr:flagellin [Pseudomonadales bacterium]
MALVINTNVSSLTAQRALAESSAELETAMERLSTGSKINSAADDAAGLAMTQRMTAQVRGLAMAVKNANDGQALTQSIEGALGEVSDMLQRMRELALQAANGTNSSADRTFLQSEVNLLIQEISRVSASTRYNGELILDGTFLNKALQVGIEEGENIIFSVDSVAAENVGAHTLVGEGVGARAAQADPLANPTTEADDIEIFGYLGTKSTAASPGDSAKQTAVKVNNLTGETGVKAYAKTYASIESTSAAQKTYSVKINGFTTGNFVISSGDVESAVDAINQVSGSTGVTASSSNNKIVLFDSDGDDITVENLQTLNGFSDLRVSKLGEDGLVSNVVGSAIDLGVSGGTDSTRVTGTLKLVSANPFSLDQKAATRASGILLNDPSIADGNTTLTFDPGHGLAVGASFTIAGETDGPTHYVTGVSGNDITFIPALVNGHGVQNDDAITIGTETPGYYADGSSTATLKDLTQIRVNTAVTAGDSISIIDAALDKVAQMRSDLGAIENRLSYTVSNLMNIAEKTADARSRLDDADFALESARLAKAQVVQQAGTQMLAQANQMTQLVLDLLR